MIKDWKVFKEDKLESKVIMNMFICRRESINTDNPNPNWVKCVETLKSIEFPTSIKTSAAHHRGLAIQVLLDTNLEDSVSFCKELLDKFLPEIPLIVIAEVNVKIKDTPIGHWYDDDLVQPGRYFDKLVSEGKNGLVIYDENTPKIVKNTDRNF